MTKPTFRSFSESTAEDWQNISMEQVDMMSKLPDRIMDHMRLLGGDCGGFPIDRLQHCLQTATLAHEGGESEEYVVCALIHDIGDTLASYNHADLAATMLQPFVSEENHWIVKHHGIFQGYYFFHHIGLDRNLRDNFKNSPHYAATERFVSLYDNPAFDPDRATKPLEFFEPMVKKVFSTPKNSMYLTDD